MRVVQRVPCYCPPQCARQWDRQVRAGRQLLFDQSQQHDAQEFFAKLVELVRYGCVRLRARLTACVMHVFWRRSRLSMVQPLRLAACSKSP